MNEYRPGEQSSPPEPHEHDFLSPQVGQQAQNQTQIVVEVIGNNSEVVVNKQHPDPSQVYQQAPPILMPQQQVNQVLSQQQVNQVPLQQNINQAPPQQQTTPHQRVRQEVIKNQDLYIIAMNQVPNEFQFDHNFYYHISCCACMGFCGTFKEKSTFNLKQLGIFKKKNKIKKFCTCGTCLCNSCDCLKCECRKHYLTAPIYILENKEKTISFEYWNNGEGRLYIAGNFVVRYETTQESYCDFYLSYWQQSQPQIFYSMPSFKEFQQRRVKIEQDYNPFPEDPYNVCCFMSCFGCFQTKRNFKVSGLGQGNVEISNKRDPSKAILKHIGCQDKCFQSFRFVDYPKFDIKFSPDVTNLDRIAIIFGLVHHSIYKKWKPHYWVGEFGYLDLPLFQLQATPKI